MNHTEKSAECKVELQAGWPLTMLKEENWKKWQEIITQFRQNYM